MMSMNFTMSMNQQVDEGRLEAEHGELDYRDSSDDEEIRLPPHRKVTDKHDLSGEDIRDGPKASDTQRDEWLLKMEYSGGSPEVE